MDTNYDDIGKLEKQLAEIKKSQAGSDYKVTELQKENARLLQEKADLETMLSGKTNEEEENYKKQSDLFMRKQSALSLAVQKGLDPTKVFSLLGLTDDDDESRLDVLVDMKNGMELEAADKFAKANGRKIEFGIASPVLDYQSMIQLSDQEISAMPDKQVHEIIHQEAESKKNTIGNKLRNWGKK